MGKAEDFDRVGSLLGDFCEAAASVVPSGGARRGHAPGVPTEGAPDVGLARDAGTPRGDLTRLLAVVWPEIAGADVAANARPVQFKRGRVVVSVSSSVWAHTLQYMGDDLKTRLNERLGPGVVGQIVFRHAGWEERPRGEPGDRSVTDRAGGQMLSEEQTEALGQLESLNLPPEIRDSIARAMKASFVRGEQDSVR
jgi:hypothetical protein